MAEIQNPNPEENNNQVPEVQLDHVLKFFEAQRAVADAMAQIIQKAIDTEQKYREQEEELQMLRQYYRNRLEFVI